MQLPPEAPTVNIFYHCTCTMWTAMEERLVCLTALTHKPTTEFRLVHKVKMLEWFVKVRMPCVWWYSKWIFIHGLCTMRSFPTQYISIPYSAKFSRVLILKLSWIFNHSRKYFNENFLTGSVQCARAANSRNYLNETIKIAIHRNLNPRKFSAIRYAITE